jgi:hypothetical protein
MRQMTAARWAEILTDNQPPCVSLYQTTHRRHPENQQDPIRYRNLLKELELALSHKYPQRETRPLIEKFQQFARDDSFWNHRTDGLAILGTADDFQVFELQRPVPELLIVADSFHTKPLLRELQSGDRYQVLALSRHEAKLYEGHRDALDEVELADEVPRTIKDALGDELTEPHLSVASYGGVNPRSGAAMHHGHGQKKDEVEIDNQRYFRAVDQAILEHHSRPSGLPLMLAALPEHHALFHEVSRNPLLMAEGISIDPMALNAQQLCEQAWKVVEPRAAEQLANRVDAYHVALAQKLGSEDLAEVAQGAIAGRIAVLLVESDRQIAGRIDAATGQIEPGDLAHPEIDDVLDDVAEIVLRMNGEVIVLPGDQMPSNTGVAAIYRY